MGRDELKLHEAASRQGLLLWKNDDGTWGVQAKPDLVPLGVEPSQVDTFIGDGMISPADGHTFPLRTDNGRTPDRARRCRGPGGVGGRRVRERLDNWYLEPASRSLLQ